MVLLGRFLTAAKLHQTIAELMEDERDLAGAVRHYEQAAELLHEENHHSMANKCILKVAEFAALEGKYQKAIKLFQVRFSSLFQYLQCHSFHLLAILRLWEIGNHHHHPNLKSKNAYFRI